MVTAENEPQPGAHTLGLCSNAEFQPCEPPIWAQFCGSNPCTYMAMGGPQCYDHLGPAP